MPDFYGSSMRYESRSQVCLTSPIKEIIDLDKNGELVNMTIEHPKE